MRSLGTHGEVIARDVPKERDIISATSITN